MDKYAPKFSKVLVTPDPHYIPGYTGYCPQLKFNMGKTYSQHTAELLTSPDVQHSGRLVLNSGRDPFTDTGDAAALTLRSLPDSNLKKTIPGYTGFIPRSQNYFSCGYSETCRRALNDFYQEMHTRSLRQSTVLPLHHRSSHKHSERPKPPLTPVTNTDLTHRPLMPFSPVSPYYMDDSDHNKYYISGFTGHVPKSRFLIGKGYPVITNQALIKFGKQQQRRDPTSPNHPGKKDSTSSQLPTIYPSNSGVIPSFTGHIPGHKFMFGHTFGQLSKDALEQSRNEGILVS